MGLFKSKEEKEQEKQAKMQQWLKDRNLEDLSEDDYAQVDRIKTELWGTGFIGALNGIVGSDKDLLRNMQYILLGISEQNWLLIKQNDKLAKQNEEIIKLLKDKN
ncbi:hypothetical protein [Limosilactobacillus vaginalis]|uniref:Uncharacterized protein n=1 Tax=Limosilactobacillus vaginalis DSM 5837 = ATCC 49540 TaxID=1423814 RepID=C2ERP7_9LACO|nr:hypothetical protein [Limosilactobacillus vaginalis]EEJ41418.1 hypothetical protein HMPREF0549_0133 [Limosilactobacillus vaginalis DSM 5837 = ATCC 49540]KRM44160.1 hypothetical protein FC58_GL001536 [Limosilactobacillus vaginalis DSM 5837 = ATCC 49540]QFS34521.1 hypothetical protein LV515_06415 [Limosilactobacillus vaginalis]